MYRGVEPSHAAPIQSHYFNNSCTYGVLHRSSFAANGHLGVNVC